MYEIEDSSQLPEKWGILTDFIVTAFISKVAHFRLGTTYEIDRSCSCLNAWLQSNQKENTFLGSPRDIVWLAFADFLRIVKFSLYPERRPNLILTQKTFQSTFYLFLFYNAIIFSVAV